MATSYLTKNKTGEKKTASKAASKAPIPSPPTAPPGSGAQLLPAPEDAQKEYERFLPAAMALDPSALRPFRADPVLAYHNVSLGLDAVLPHEDRIKSELPKVDRAALRALPSLALAVGFAALQVDRGAGGATIAPRMRRAHELRWTRMCHRSSRGRRRLGKSLRHLRACEA